VIVLQTLLNRHDSSLVEDGAFGRSTLDAVLAFQDKLSLTVDGIVGPATWKALRQQVRIANS
jgi:peptidoglycan hydrolase-like protein with peptidoglycan-binding domain